MSPSNEGLLKRPSDRNAVALFSVLLAIVILLMMIGAALTIMRSTAGISGSAQENQAALYAAEAGMSYARTRLQERPSWRGDGDGSTTTVTVVRTSDDRLIVTEDNGLVVGYIKSPSGLNAQFRLRFNYHDGTGGGDNLDDPSVLLPGPYVSVNNLANPTSAPVPRAVDNGSVWEVTASSPMPYDCPKYCANIYVEGLAGPGLREQLANPANPNPLPGPGRVVSRMTEANFRRKVSTISDSAIYAALDISSELIDGGEFLVESEDSATPPRIRSNQNVLIDALSGGSATYNTPSNGEVYVGDSGTFTVNSLPGSPGATQQTTTRDEFFQLDWGDIKKADPSTAMNVRAGTYVWRPGTPPYMEYYAEDYNPANTYAPGSGTIITNPNQMQVGGPSGAIAMDRDLIRLEFSNDVYVQPEGAATGFAVIPHDPTWARPFNHFRETAAGEAPVLTSAGSVQFMGELDGIGSVTAEGDVHFQGPSALEVAPDSAVAIYSRQDVHLEAIWLPGGATTGATAGTSTVTATTGAATSSVAAVASGSGSGSGAVLGTSPPVEALEYQDQAYAGVIFAMGDFITELGPDQPDGGQLFIRGVVVAYGGDPENNDDPGASGEGQVRVEARHAQFKFDPSYIDVLLDTNAPTHLTRTLFAVL